LYGLPVEQLSQMSEDGVLQLIKAVDLYWVHKSHTIYCLVMDSAIIKNDERV